MYRALVLVVVFLAAARADTADDMKKCKRVFNPRSRHCCKSGPTTPPMHEMIDMKECMQLDGKPPSCEREICMAIKHGVVTSDGKIDKDGVQKMIDKYFSETPDFLKLMQDNCVDGDISKYGEADLCDPLKLKLCMDVQFATGCSEWLDEGECAGTKELAQECVEKFA